MAAYTQVTTAVTGNTITAAIWNSEFTAIATSLNSISNAQIASDAAISASKISGTAATLTGSETLTNKTLTNPVLTKPTVNGSVAAYTSDSDGATVTFDMTSSNVHTVTLAGNRTLAVSNVSVGQPFIIRLVQDATGSRTVTWFSTIKWPGGSAPTLTTTASRVDTFGFICTSSNNYDGYIIGQDLA